jgi:hypothetical protein
MTRFRTIALQAGLAGALLCVALSAPNAYAAPYYDDGMGNGCVTCHPGFQGGNQPLHTQHRNLADQKCGLCHPTNGGGTTPVQTFFSASAGSRGCAGCHGQDYGETSPTSGQPKSTAYGLRLVHVNAVPSVTTCGTGGCHQPGSLGHPDPFPPLFGEQVAPTYYAPGFAILRNPCSSAEEDLPFDPDSLGLDNDGDGARDWPADADCPQPTTTSTTTSTTLPYPIANAAAFKCQSATSKGGAKFVGAKAKCLLKCQANARKGVNPFADCYPPYGGTTQFCVGDVVKGAQTKFAAAIVKGCTKTPTDCPSCYSGGDCSVTGHAAATVASLEGQLDAFIPAVACEQTTDKAKAKCIDGTAKTLSKFAASMTKCYDKCYASAQKGAISANTCTPSASDDATEACISKAGDKAASGIDKACFTAPAVKPACYDGGVHPPAIIPSPDSGNDWVDLVELAVEATVPQTYCGP